MSFRDKERDRQFQLKVLSVQLKHERLVGFYNAAMSMGTAFVVLGTTIILTAHLISEKPISILWNWILTAYITLGGVLVIVCARLLTRLEFSTKREIERIKKKYLEW